MVAFIGGVVLVASGVGGGEAGDAKEGRKKKDEMGRWD